MSAVVIPLNVTPLDERIAVRPSLLSVDAELPEIVPPVIRRRSIEANTGSVEGDIPPTGAEPPPVSRVYPHVFDESQVSGKATLYIRNALNDAREAADAFGEPNLEAVATHLSNIAVSMSAAFPLTEFNESLGSVVSHIRRATLIASMDDLSRSGLNALISVLESISTNPMIDLNDASDLTEILSDEGWNGDHALAAQLISALISDGDLDEDLQRTLIFTEQTASEN